MAAATAAGINVLRMLSLTDDRSDPRSRARNDRSTGAELRGAVTRGTPSSKGSVVRSTSATPRSASHAQVHSVPAARAPSSRNCKTCTTPCDCAGRDRGRAKARPPDPKTLQSDATCDSSPHERRASVFGLTPFRGQFAAQKSSPDPGPQGGPPADDSSLVSAESPFRQPGPARFVSSISANDLRQ